MKIKYKKIICSTKDAPTTLIRNIISELEKQDYKILNQTQNCVTFKYNIEGFGFRTEVFRNVDGGTFNLISESKTIVFSYYLSPLFEIFAICIVAFLGITRDYHIFFFVVFIALMFIVRIISVKIAANTIIENILYPELL